MRIWETLDKDRGSEVFLMRGDSSVYQRIIVFGDLWEDRNNKLEGYDKLEELIRGEEFKREENRRKCRL